MPSGRSGTVIGPANAGRNVRWRLMGSSLRRRCYFPARAVLPALGTSEFLRSRLGEVLARLKTWSLGQQHAHSGRSFRGRPTCARLSPWG